MIPRVLLTDTDRRPYTARLAMAFAAAGCEVSVVSTPKHPIHKATVLRRRFPYHAFRPLASLLDAIDAVAPHLLVPCDDRAVKHLHDLYALVQSRPAGGNHLAGLIERSLGPAASYPIVSARYDLLQIATEQGLRVPATMLVNSVDDLKRWARQQPLPWVLKADGTWGGRGVKIAHTAEEAQQLFLAMKHPCSLRRAVKRLCINRDPFYFEEWWDGFSPSVIVQACIQGHPANCAVSCWEGEILAGSGVEVVQADGSTGPASIVRVVDNAEMMNAAGRLARRLRTSGFFGLCFIIEEGSGAAYLLEMNPRCTPLCHLHLGEGHDMVGSLCARLTGKRLPQRQPDSERETIAYFPQAWIAKCEMLPCYFQDYPHAEPALAEELLRPWPERSLLVRLFNSLTQVPSGQGEKPVPSTAMLKGVKSKGVSPAE